MPYTAPLQFSPSATKPASPPSPSPARTNSAQNVPTSPARPPLPRSYSSTSYIRRHRRSPSVSKTVNSGTVEISSPGTSHSSNSFDPHASLRQSPPPVSNGMIPKGAIISPPESAPNSSDDDEVLVVTGDGQRGQMTVEELDAAIRNIQLERDSSPSISAHQEQTKEEQGNVATLRLANGRPSLTAEARKISHSRSSTESSIPKVVESRASSPSDSDREEDGDMPRKPPMVRKKSGELVRPALRPATRKRRPSSMPGTPTYAKNVHFDTQLEHIRHFLQLDKPLAVSANTSPVETYNAETEYPFYPNNNLPKAPAYEWEIRLANFPRDTVERVKQPVRLERLFLSSDNKNLVGVVSVANLSFHKQVVARFTYDYWKTVSEVSGEYNHDVRRKQAHDGYDRFNFTIKLADQANLENKTMFMCIRYTVGGQEYWDNNNSMNYQVDFSKKEKTVTGNPSVSATSPRQASPLPRSRALPTSHNTRPRSMPASFDDFASGLDDFRSFNLGHDSLTVESPLSLTHEDDQELLPDTPRRREKPAPQAFGHRYDFGLSLSAAMQNSTPSQDRTMLSAKAKSESQSQSVPRENSQIDRPKAESSLYRISSRSTLPAKEEARTETLKPSSIVSSKPHLESSVYKELVDKYCFFGSTKSSVVPEPAGPAPQSKPPSPPTTESRTHGTCASAATLPSYEDYLPRIDSAISMNSPSRSSASSPSSSNPTSRTTSPSPQYFQFSHHQSMHNDFLKESQTPTIIRG